MANNRIGGVLTLTIDGNTYQVRGNWTVSPNRVKRDGVAGQDGVHGYTEMPVVPGAKGDFTATPGVSVTNLQNITDSTLQLTLANGSTYVLADAWANPAVEINTSEGRYPIDFGCLTCTEIVSAS
jgi:hypothetical protein